MDVDLLFALLLLAFYLATQIFGRKKRMPEAPPRDVETAERPAHSAELDDALREIREALGWPSEAEQTPQPAPAPPKPTPAEPVDRRSRLERDRPGRRVEKPTFLGEESATNEWEVARQRAERKKAEVAARFGQPAGIPELKGPSRDRRVHPIARKLRSHQGARDAVIYSEIFQPRWNNDMH